MDFGQLSVSLTVKDIVKSQHFYQCLGFTSMADVGSIKEKWLLMPKDKVVIALIKGMFEQNIMTFNPKDARTIEE